MEFASDEYFMREALRQARRAYAADEVPCGAIIVRGGEIIARAWNQVEMLKDATAHAEMLAITQAEAAMEDWRLTDCDLYVTKEPCPMCAQAASFFRVARVVFGAYDPKGGGVDHGARVFAASSCHHRPEVVGGVREADCAALLRGFFEARR
jgi:tRNA(adenine34) deaminase